MDANTGTNTANVIGTIPWQLDRNGYFVCLGGDGQVYRSTHPVEEANHTNPLTFVAIGALPTNLIGKFGAAARTQAPLADRAPATSGASAR